MYILIQFNEWAWLIDIPYYVKNVCEKFEVRSLFTVASVA